MGHEEYTGKLLMQSKSYLYEWGKLLFKNS